MQSMIQKNDYSFGETATDTLKQHAVIQSFPEKTKLPWQKEII